MIERQLDREVVRQRGSQIERQLEREVVRQRCSQIERLLDREVVRQRGSQIEIDFQKDERHGVIDNIQEER